MHKCVEFCGFVDKLLRIFLIEVSEKTRHGFIAASETLDGEVIKLVVCSIKILNSFQQSIFSVFEILNALVDVVDGFFEIGGGTVGIQGKTGLESVELVFEICDVDILVFNAGELSFVGEGIFGGTDEDADERQEKLRADDVHFWIFVGNVDDAAVIEFVFGFEHGDEHGIFALFLGAVFVELFEEVFVLMLRSGGIVFVFHFEHNTDNFVASFVKVAKDEIALGAGSRDGIILAELGAGKSGGADGIKLILTMLLESFADHFGGKFRFHVLETLDSVIAIADLLLVVLFQHQLARRAESGGVI